MGRIIGAVLGAILAIWLVLTTAGGILATFKTLVIIGLIAMAVFIVVWLLARRPHRGQRGHSHLIKGGSRLCCSSIFEIIFGLRRCRRRRVAHRLQAAR
jgi:hypothetical protein